LNRKDLLKEYFITTNRLGFSKWTENLLPEARLLWGDSEVTKLIGGKMTDKEIQKRLQREIDNEKQFRVQYWPLFLINSGEFVGCCGLRPYHPKGNTYEIGFHIASSHWRRGFAFEASQAVIGYSFGKLGVSSLFAGHNPKNSASGKLLEKLGFQYSHDEFYPPTGLNHPSYFLKRN